MRGRARGLALAAAVAVATLAAPGRAAAQVAAPDAAHRVDEIFAPWTSTTSPGCAVGVRRNGLTVLERAYGMADLEHGIPNTPATTFEGGSLSKQFTAAAVVLLVLDGVLSLDDDVRRWIPEVPDYGHTITLKHLMTHTSGLRDWGSVAGISGWGRGERTHDHRHVLDIVSRQSALNFEPGHEYSYSNTGYNLLAIVVTRASGIPFAEFSRERIFEPLGLRNTQWRDDYRRIVPGRSSAYRTTDDDGWEIDRPIEDVHGNGGILTTVGDLGIWNAALDDGRLGGPQFVRLMHETGRLSDGSLTVYAGGLRLEEPVGFLASISHTGSTAGYRAFLGRYPDHGLSVAMLCNASNVPTGPTGYRIAEAFVGDAAPVPPEPAYGEAARPQDARFAGLYHDPVTGSTRTLTFDGTLRDGSTPLLRLSGREFQVGIGPARYVFDEGEGRVGFREESWEYTNQRWEPVEPWTPAAGDLAAFAGTYHSADAETTYRISVEDGALVVWQRPGVTRTLEPIYRDAFRMGGSIVRFRRGPSGAVDALSLSLGRVYDMRFARTGG